MSRFFKIFKNPKPIIGMIHLPPLLGFAGCPGIKAIIEKALSDLVVLEGGGIDGVLIENEDDHPHTITASAGVIDYFVRTAKRVVKKAKVPVGIEVLLNDPKASLKIAKSSGAAFIRTDYFVDEMMREGYGEMEIDPKGLIDFRKKIGAENIAIFTDIQVKFAKMLGEKDIVDSAKEAIAYQSDAVIVTGKFTGEQPNIENLKRVKMAVDKFPVLVGSGFNKENARMLLECADGVIVGTAIIQDKRVAQNKVNQLMEVVRKFRK